MTTTTRIALTDQSIEDLVMALGVRIAFIETGTASLRAQDLLAQGRGKELRVLTEEQKVAVTRMKGYARFFSRSSLSSACPRVSLLRTR